MVNSWKVAGMTCTEIGCDLEMGNDESMICSFLVPFVAVLDKVTEVGGGNVSITSFTIFGLFYFSLPRAIVSPGNVDPFHLAR